jgi:hypothetical protein
MGEILNRDQLDGQVNLPSSTPLVLDLRSREPGRVLTLPKRARDPVFSNVVGKPSFRAYPVQYVIQKDPRMDCRSFLAVPRGKEFR